jgi:glucose-6-phosphate isomerase
MGMKTGIRLYYKNVTSEVLGNEHGISKAQFDQLAKQVTPAIKKVNEIRAEGKLAYRDLPFNKDIPARVKQVAASIKGCENFVVLGIGGSALGNIALQTALNPYMYNLDDRQRNGKPRMFVFDNVDPAQLKSFLDWAGDKLDKTIFNVISKSGQTAETASQFAIINDMLGKKVGMGKRREHIIATTDPKEGTLRKLADKEKYQCLEVPDGVGGRWSVLSAVGLLSAAVCGIDIDQLLAGARDMDKVVSGEDFYKNPAALNAGVNWHYINRGKNITVLMPYCYALKDMSDWFRQLWAESLGKEKDNSGNIVNVGSTPVKALGTTDQHSQVQLYREGPNDKLFTFLQVKDFGKEDLTIGPAPDFAPELAYLGNKKMSTLLNSEKVATEYALVYSKRPNMTVLFDEVSPYTVGQFICLFEVTTSIAGVLLNINAYDQPAVELGKQATFALMDRPGYEQLAAQISPFANPDESYMV